MKRSRSDCESLRTLIDQQAQKIAESTLYTKDLVEKNNILKQNVEELVCEMTEAGEEVVRWREACELEVEAGKTAIEEREMEVVFLKKELERTKAELDESSRKLKLKEKLATTAIAAQAAAEISLQLADSRSAGLRDRIEELMRQLEEEVDRGRKERGGGMKVRHMCWPWQALRLTPNAGAGSAVAAASREGNRKTLPELEALLHIHI